MISIQYLNQTFKEMFNSDCIPKLKLMQRNRNAIAPVNGHIQRASNCQYQGISFEKFCNFLSLTGASKISGYDSDISRLGRTEKSRQNNFANRQDNSSNIKVFTENSVSLTPRSQSKSDIKIKSLNDSDPFLKQIYFQKVPYKIKDKEVEQIEDQYFNPQNLFKSLQKFENG